MRKYLAKLAYRVAQKEVLEEVVNDFYGNIDQKTKDTGVFVASQYRDGLYNWIHAMCFHISRRIPNTNKGVDVHWGSLLFARLLLQMIGAEGVKAEKPVVPLSKTKEKKLQEEYDNAMKGVSEFRGSNKKV
jgi:hypothetical protein